MRFLSLSFWFGILLAVPGVASSIKKSTPDCVSFAQATKLVGTSQCVRGTVLHVEEGRNGGKVLSFCKDAAACSFTVVVYPSDVRRVGDVQQLEGRQIEIKGTVQDHEGRAEIVLRRTQQLQGDAAFLLFPKVPTDYDVERQGRNSAGKYSHPKEAKKTAVKKTEAEPLSVEDPEGP